MLKFKTVTGSISSANATITSLGGPSGSSLLDVSGGGGGGSDLDGAVGSIGRSGHLRATPSTLSRKSSFLSSESGFSKANIIFQNVSVPLAWPTDEYFGNRKESREFTVQLLLRTKEGREVFSRVRENVTRAVTNINFDESFVFPFQSPGFCVEVIVYCKRTDENANPNLVQSLSRSLGRSLGHSLKNYLKGTNNTISGSSRYYDNKEDISAPAYRRSSRNTIDADFIENYRNPEKMCALGRAKFRLRNASLSGLTHTYSIEVFPHDTHAYGSICAMVLAQPASVSTPLAEGSLDMFFVEGAILLQRMFCVLQGGQLKCYNEDEKTDAKESTSVGEKNRRFTENAPAGSPSLVIEIDKECSVEPTAFPSALRLRLVEAASRGECGAFAPPARHILFISESRSSFLGWRNAFVLQITDCAVWADFASSLKNPHAAALRLPDFVNSASPPPKISQKVRNTSSTLLYQRTPPSQSRSTSGGENPPPRRSRNGRHRAPIVSEYFQPMKKDEICEKQNEKEDATKIVKSLLSDINARNVRLITDTVKTDNENKLLQTQLNSQAHVINTDLENGEDSLHNTIAMQTRNDEGADINGNLVKATRNTNDMTTIESRKSKIEKSLTTDHQTAKEKHKKESINQSVHKFIKTADNASQTGQPVAANQTAVERQLATKTECINQLNKQKQTEENEIKLQVSALLKTNEAPKSARMRHFVKKSDSTVGGRIGASDKTRGQTTQKASAQTIVQDLAPITLNAISFKTPEKPPRRSESISSRNTVERFDFDKSVGDKEDREKKFVLKIGIADDKNTDESSGFARSPAKTSTNITHSAAQSSSFIESDTSTSASTASIRLHSQLPSSSETDKSYSNLRQRIFNDQFEHNKPESGQIILSTSLKEDNLIDSILTESNTRNLGCVEDQGVKKQINGPKAKYDLYPPNFAWTSSADSTTSSSASGRETQTARAIFFDSDSASFKAGSASNPTTPLTPVSNSSNISTKFDANFRLKSSASFAENRRKFEELAASHANNQHEDGERDGGKNRRRVEERPRQGSALKKCSSALLSNRLPYGSERINDMPNRTPKPESTVMPTFSREPTNDWQTVTTMTPLCAPRNNLFDNAHQFSTFKETLQEKNAANAPKGRANTLAYGSYGGENDNFEGLTFLRGIDAKVINRPNAAFPSDYRKNAPILRTDTFHRNRTRFPADLALTHSTKL